MYTRTTLSALLVLLLTVLLSWSQYSVYWTESWSSHGLIKYSEWSARFIAYTNGRPRTEPDLLDLDIDDALIGLKNGVFTSQDLTRAYLARLHEINKDLHVVIEINPDALEIAASMDSLRKSNSVIGPLHGIPILIKDNLATKDKMNTTAGSFALLGATTSRDSTVVAKLRKAGAVILGKTNMSQWANYRSVDSTNGWSARGGQCFGAWHHAQDPSGSSSGSAVAASLGLSLGTIGTETDGSIVSPAGVNGVVGLKPTVGLTSRCLVIPISSHQDTIGPITRTVRDAAHMLQSIVGHDACDDASVDLPPVDYLAACELGIRGLTMVVAQQLIESDIPDYIAVSFADAIDTLKHLGAKVVDGTLPLYDEFVASKNESLVLSYDFGQDLAGYLAKLETNPNGIASLQDLLSYTQTDAREVYAQRNTDLWHASLELQKSDDSAAAAAAAVEANERLGGAEGILAALDAADGTVLMLPTRYASTIAAIAGYPILTVPLGYAPADTPVVWNVNNETVAEGPGIPYGVSFIARRFDEQSLFRVGCAFEQATKVIEHRRPLVLPRTQLHM